MPTLEELGQKVKARFPGQYDDLSDIDVATRVKAKHPGAYDDFGPSGPTIPPNPSDSIPAAKPPIPAGLQGPPPSRLQQMVQNIPQSAANAIIHPTFPGQPAGMETIDESDPRSGYEKFTEESLPKITHAIQHPIDTVEDAFTDDPVGSALTVAQIGRGAHEFGEPIADAAKTGVAVAKGAAQGAKEAALSTTEVPGHSYAARALKAVGINRVPTVPVGAVIGKYAGHALFGPEAGVAGEVIGAAAPIVRGAWRGGKQALQDLQTPPSVEVPPVEATATSTPVPAPSPTPLPESRQLAPGRPPIVTPAPADTSGVIKGWQPTILENENVPTEAAAKPAGPSLPSLDEIAQGWGYNDFAAVKDPKDIVAITRIAESFKKPATPSSQAPPVDLAPPPSPETPPSVSAEPASTAKPRTLWQQIDDERAAGIDPRTGKPMVPHTLQDQLRAGAASSAPPANLPAVGDEIEFTQSLGVHGGTPQRAIVTELRRDPTTGDMVPIVNAGGIQLPVAEYPVNGKIIKRGGPQSVAQSAPAPAGPPMPSGPPSEGAYPIPDEARTGPPGTAPREAYENAARTAKARGLARWLNSAGIKYEDAAALKPEDWAREAASSGYALPSPKTIEQALTELKGMQAKQTVAPPPAAAAAPAQGEPPLSVAQPPVNVPQRLELGGDAAPKFSKARGMKASAAKRNGANGNLQPGIPSSPEVPPNPYR